MSRRGTSGVAALGLLLVMASGCADGARPRDATAPGPVRILAQRSHAQCPVEGRDTRQVRLQSAAQWQAVVSMDEAAALGRPVDWTAEQVVLHAMSQQPTLGYEAVAVDAEVLADGSLRLRVSERRPPPGAIVGMAFTRPCVFVLLPSAAWPAIDVRDADRDRSLGRAEAPEAETRRPGGAVGGPSIPPSPPREQAR